MKAPIQLANYRIKKINFEVVKDFEEFNLENAPFSIDVDFNLYSDNENPLRYKVDLFLKVLPSLEEKMHLPYEIEMILQGVFFFEEDLEEEEKVYHLNISCPTMLYGAARNIIHQITGQTNYGAISIPAVQFSKIAEEKQKEEKETANNNDDL